MMDVWQMCLYRALIQTFVLIGLLLANDQVEDIRLGFLWISLMTFIYLIKLKDTLYHRYNLLLSTSIISLWLIVSTLLFFTYSMYPKLGDWMSLIHKDLIMYINLGNIFYTFQKTLLITLFYCFKKVRSLAVQKKKYGFALIYVIITSFILIYILELAYSFSLNFIEKSKHSYTSEQYMQKKKIRYGLRYDKENFFIKRVYVVDNENTIILKMKQKHNGGMNISHTIYTYYVGEDVSIKCFLVSKLYHSNGINYQYHWALNGVKLRPTHRHSISVTHLSSRHIELVLNIILLEESDFGLYSCVEEYAVYGSFDQTFYIEENKFADYGYELFSISHKVIDLKQIKTNVEVMHLRWYDISYFTDYDFNYRTLTGYDDPVSFTHLINNRVPSFYFDLISQCSIRRQLFEIIYFILENKYDIFQYFNLRYNPTQGKAFRSLEQIDHFVEITFCAQSPVYGWHNVTFWREHFNEKRNKIEMIEIHNPNFFLVLPERKRPFPYGIFNDTDLYEAFEQKVVSNGPYAKLDELLFSLIKANERKLLIIDNVLVCCVVLLFLFLFFTLIVWFSKKCYKFIIVLPAIRLHCVYKLADGQQNEEEQEQYDVFISHSDADYPWVSTSLLPHLEGRLGLRVCFPDRDFSPTRTIIGSTVSATDNSRRVVVVLTDEYMADRGGYALQVEHLLLPTIYEGHRQERSVILLNLRNAPVPRPLRWNFELNYINWHNLPEDENIRQLEAWFERDDLKCTYMCTIV